jgi:hypothetical protein
LELSETANTRTEFEAKTTQRKEYFKLVELMYNTYTSRVSDANSPWPEPPANLYRDMYPDLRSLNPCEVDQYRDSDYLKKVWDKLRRRIWTVMEAFERSGQNEDGSWKDPWDFRFMTMPPGTQTGKSRCVFEIFYCFLLARDRPHLLRNIRTTLENEERFSGDIILEDGTEVDGAVSGGVPPAAAAPEQTPSKAPQFLDVRHSPPSETSFPSSSGSSGGKSALERKMDAALERLEDMALSMTAETAPSSARDRHHAEMARLNNIRARGALTEQFTLLMKATERKGASEDDLEWLLSMKRQVQSDMQALLSSGTARGTSQGDLAGCASQADSSRTEHAVGTESGEGDMQF